MQFVSEFIKSFCLVSDRCPFNKDSLWNVLEELREAHKKTRFCDLPLFGETPELDKDVLAAVRNGTSNTSTVSDSLYNKAINILVCRTEEETS